MKALALLATLAGLAAAADPASLLRVGRSAAGDGEWQRAENLLARAEEGSRLLNNPSMELAARLSRVDLRLIAEELDSAGALVPDLPRRPLSSADSAVWNLCRARVALLRGELDRARSAADAAWKAAGRSGEEPIRVATAILLGRVQLAQGEIRGAKRRWKEVRGNRGDSPVLGASALMLATRIRLAEGDVTGASTAMLEAMELWRSTQDVPGMLSALPLRAQVWAALGDTAAERETWDAAAYIAERTGLPRVALRATILGGATSPPAAPSRHARAREILRATGIPPEDLPPELRSRLP